MEPPTVDVPIQSYPCIRNKDGNGTKSAGSKQTLASVDAANEYNFHLQPAHVFLAPISDNLASIQMVAALSMKRMKYLPGEEFHLQYWTWLSHDP